MAMLAYERFSTFIDTKFCTALLLIAFPNIIAGCGGFVGLVCVSLFATTAVNPHGANGLFYGEIKLFWHTLVVIVVVIPFICIFSYLCYWVTDHIVPLHMKPAVVPLARSAHKKHSENITRKPQQRPAREPVRSEHHQNSSDSSSKAPAKPPVRGSEQSSAASTPVNAVGTRGGPMLDS